MKPETFNALIDALRIAGFADRDIEWSENATMPEDADDFASEAIFVICNSGMKNTIARQIFERVRDAIWDGQSAATAFGHKGKAAAIDQIWKDRARLFAEYMATPDKVEYCATLPWIGQITKYHLAKNFGADVAKPDVHLQRLADTFRTTPQALCETLAKSSGYKIRTIDVLLWRAAATGILDTSTGELRP